MLALVHARALQLQRRLPGQPLGELGVVLVERGPVLPARDGDRADRPGAHDQGRGEGRLPRPRGRNRPGGRDRGAGRLPVLGRQLDGAAVAERRDAEVGEPLEAAREPRLLLQCGGRARQERRAPLAAAGRVEQRVALGRQAVEPARDDRGAADADEREQRQPAQLEPQGAAGVAQGVGGVPAHEDRPSRARAGS